MTQRGRSAFIPHRVNCSDFRRIPISISGYIKQLSMFVLSSSSVLGLILGIGLLVIGETSMEADLTFEFGTLDGFWLIFGLPLVSTLIFVILSPLSFPIHKLISRKSTESESPDP